MVCFLLLGLIVSIIFFIIGLCISKNYQDTEIQINFSDKRILDWLKCSTESWCNCSSVGIRIISRSIVFISESSFFYFFILLFLNLLDSCLDFKDLVRSVGQYILYSTAVIVGVGGMHWQKWKLLYDRFNELIDSELNSPPNEVEDEYICLLKDIYWLLDTIRLDMWANKNFQGMTKITLKRCSKFDACCKKNFWDQRSFDKVELIKELGRISDKLLAKIQKRRGFLGE